MQAEATPAHSRAEALRAGDQSARRTHRPSQLAPPSGLPEVSRPNTTTSQKRQRQSPEGRELCATDPPRRSQLSHRHKVSSEGIEDVLMAATLACVRIAYALDYARA